ncbi:MAG TPA: acyl-CoA synthetase [Oceanospirillales bacterium]|nr:acyl-CoA synthetase [Oceanospirillales bacterium]|tara:strand:- start:2884 stop:4542 length:1659 start_codon:yes stop_codon:yes gene_type:complete
MSVNIYNQNLDQNHANYTALSPISFLERAAFIYPNKLATMNGDIRRNWSEVFTRCRQIACALNKRGFGKGDTISIIAPNINEHFEAHFAIPMSGAILNSINTRLDAEAIAFIMQHAETKVLFVEKEFSVVVDKALRMLPNKPLVIDIEDVNFEGTPEMHSLGSMTYDQLLAEGDEDYEYPRLENEWDAITLNYTSGTTGNPKGVVYHYRGAYLNAISNMMSWNMQDHPVYLWTLPMFHCNGWCFPWAIAAKAGVSVSLRHVVAEDIFNSIRENKVTHFCGAPIVLNMMNSADESMKGDINHEVKVMTAGAPPPASVIQGMEDMGIRVTHTYGLTETYGPSVVCAWNDDWNNETDEQKARLKSRQGVKAPMLEGLMVADPETLEPVPQDGETVGEIFMRGNLVMKGYLKNPSTTDAAFEGGWFRSGDLAVWHPDGYAEIKDRSKDVIISGGENISSIEVEDVLYRHPKVSEVAIVARPCEKWGETPCAFISLMEGCEANVDITEEEIIQFSRDNMASFKVPKTVIFGDLPKTSTGKIQKFMLRKVAQELNEAS